ncbi:MAG: hypothetical protein BIFFINMI_03402 [Phycisphaerae bacterium]|nr:hypothetical protein [Phycisphaerae bacterium]
MGLLGWLRTLFGTPGPAGGRAAGAIHPKTLEVIPRGSRARWIERLVSKARAEGKNPGLARLKYLLSLNRRRLAHWAFHAGDCYRAVEIPKRNGSTRTLHVPPPPLKFIQRRILKRILGRVDLAPCVKGFRRGYSIRGNAWPHVGKDVVLNLDLRDFFPTITAARVFGMFKSLGLDKPTADVLTRLTTCQGRLPQGAPTSPAISNIICRKLDRRLEGLARSAGAAYTRYADDLTFSGPAGIQSILPLVRRIIGEEGFAVAPEKLRVTRRCRRQQVTGLVVNEKVAVPRQERRRLRAIVHNCVRDGIGSQSRGDPIFLLRLIGRIEFLRMIDRERGEALLAELAQARP